MKKKLLAAFLVGIMSLSMIGCGSDADSTASVTEDGEEIWECVVPWPSIGESPEGLADVEAAVNEITEAQIGVHVTLDPIYCFDLNSQQTLAISSGDKLDLCLIMLETNASYVNNESIIDITDLYEEYGSNINAAIGDAVEACSINHKLYSIPVANLLGKSYGFLFRSDLLEKYGYSTENQNVTYDELEEIFATVKAGEPSSLYMIGGVLYEDYGQYDDLGTSPSSGVLMIGKDDTTVVNLYETEEFAEYAKRMYEWNQLGYIAPDSSSTDAGTDLIRAGQYAGQASSTTPGQNGWAQQNAGYAMTSPTTVSPYGKTTDLSNISWGITANCDNPEKAMQLIDLMYADNNLGTILTAGIENVDYVITDSDDNGNIIITYPEGLDSSTIPYYNMFGVWPNNKSQLEPMTLEYFSDIDAFNSNMVYSKAFGYTFDASDYSTQLAAIDSVVAQYEDTIQGGKANPDTVLPQFIQALKDAGIDEVIAANQTQYDAWLAGE